MFVVEAVVLAAFVVSLFGVIALAAWVDSVVLTAVRVFLALSLVETALELWVASLEEVRLALVDLVAMTTLSAFLVLALLEVVVLAVSLDSVMGDFILV
ncbi:hypothetical protein EFP00_15375 [Lactiplantibacillus paraplantarum]|nr:hypothetical protein [Lactiplantibacillus paraplantarum]